MFYLYIIYSKKLDKYYVGYSSDIKERLRKHNTSNKSYTGKANDWELKYTEQFATKEEAMYREKQIKKWKSRKLIIQLIRKEK